MTNDIARICGVSSQRFLAETCATKYIFTARTMNCINDTKDNSIHEIILSSSWLSTYTESGMEPKARNDYYNDYKISRK